MERMRIEVSNVEQCLMDMEMEEFAETLTKKGTFRQLPLLTKTESGYGNRAT